MGYYTRFTLKTQPPELYEKAIQIIVKELAFNPFEDDEVKWYDCNDDITEISQHKDLKDVLLIIDGEGEEQGDVWRLFAKNGKLEHHSQPEWSPPDQPTTL